MDPIGYALVFLRFFMPWDSPLNPGPPSLAAIVKKRCAHAPPFTATAAHRERGVLAGQVRPHLRANWFKTFVSVYIYIYLTIHKRVYICISKHI